MHFGGHKGVHPDPELHGDRLWSKYFEMRVVEYHLTTCLKGFFDSHLLYGQGDSPKCVHFEVPNVSTLTPKKKGSGQDEALGDSIEHVPKMHKYPLKQVAVLTNRDQKLYRFANRSRSSWTRFDSQQGLMSR